MNQKHMIKFVLKHIDVFKELRLEMAPVFGPGSL